MAEQSTKWYENTAEGTFHEVLEGSDTEKRMKREQRQVDEDSWEPAYRPLGASQVPGATSQPGYAKKDGTPASPAEVVQEVLPQTPTADTNRGPLVGEPGAEEQAEREVELGGAAPSGVEPEVTAEQVTASSRSRKPRG